MKTFSDHDAKTMGLFQRLGVQRTATKDEIQKAYTQAVAKKKNETDNETLSKLNLAKGILLNDVSRAAYIEALEKYDSKDGLGTGL